MNTVITPGCGGGFVTTTTLKDNEITVETCWIKHGSSDSKVIGSTTYDLPSIAAEHIDRHAWRTQPQYVE